VSGIGEPSLFGSRLGEGRWASPAALDYRPLH